MRFNVKSFTIIVITLSLIFLLFACGDTTLYTTDDNSPTTDPTISNGTPKKDQQIDSNITPSEETGAPSINNTTTTFFYYDNIPPIINSISYTFSFSETFADLNSYSNKDLTFRIKATSHNPSPQSISISDIYCIRLSTNATYKATKTYYKDTWQTTLQQDIDYFWNHVITIPTSFKDEKYLFCFSINGEKYSIYLYETPNEERTDCSVKYYVDNTLVYEITIKKGRKLDLDYCWESNNHLQYCDTWKSNGVTYNKNSTINDNVMLFGSAKDNISYTHETDGDYIKIINHVPSDGILVFNSSNRLIVSLFAIRNNNLIKEIYFPNNLYKIYSGNFTGVSNLKTIHYAGSKEEWDNIISSATSTIPSSVTVIYNSIYPD